MNVKQAAEATGIPSKTLRYYEEVGLVRPARAENGYRVYAETDLRKLVFVGRARGLGFSLEDCRRLLSLYEDQSRASADVKVLARSHVDEIDRKLKELRAIKAELNRLISACHGDDRPDCPIVEGLAGSQACRTEA
ncbi:Cu(I)-responsive transcriptional regulator [Maricaulis sp. D1M11]|jgi:Cu(I)-responsive transcriptional regulator|uniref:Cu(I)-responsive transcriptional regulator n=1 Tax=Maricaulis sp. D1M11 TaxID=3076117 RepID=UPI001D558A2A|nr:Cu(I)-responsive transcriptional regulator [Alphaproteobacteria bacterium]